MEQIKIIAMDLDGTLLDSEKRLSEENRAAIQRAAEMGIEIVPTTGRIYDIIPEAVDGGSAVLPDAFQQCCHLAYRVSSEPFIIIGSQHCRKVCLG